MSDTDLGIPRNVIESGSAVTTSISGNNVVITSGNVLARVSGENIVITSGNVLARISGEVVKVSGETVYVANTSGRLNSDNTGNTKIALIDVNGVTGATVRPAPASDDLSNNLPHLLTAAALYGNQQGGGWNRIRVNKSGQGALAVASSGVDGIVLEPSTDGFTAPELKITSNSGGVQLLSGAVNGLSIVPPSGNSGNLYLGFTSSRPYSGYGIRIEPGVPVSLHIDNPNAVFLFAQVSGDIVSYGGVN